MYWPMCVSGGAGPPQWAMQWRKVGTPALGVRRSRRAPVAAAWGRPPWQWSMRGGHRRRVPREREGESWPAVLSRRWEGASAGGWGGWLVRAAHRRRVAPFIGHTRAGGKQWGREKHGQPQTPGLADDGGRGGSGVHPRGPRPVPSRRVVPFSPPLHFPFLVLPPPRPTVFQCRARPVWRPSTPPWPSRWWRWPPSPPPAGRRSSSMWAVARCPAAGPPTTRPC